jgi:hypothetical protein
MCTRERYSLLRSGNSVQNCVCDRSGSAGSAAAASATIMLFIRCSRGCWKTCWWRAAIWEAVCLFFKRLSILRKCALDEGTESSEEAISSTPRKSLCIVSSRRKYGDLTILNLLSKMARMSQGPQPHCLPVTITRHAAQKSSLVIHRPINIPMAVAYHLPTRWNKGKNRNPTVVVIISRSIDDIILPLPFTDDSEKAVAMTWLAAHCA